MMLDETGKAQFLRVGLERYPDARDTVDYFQASVVDAIISAFSEKTTWKNFQPRRDAEGNMETGKVIGSGDRYIQAWVLGALPRLSETKERVWLSLGLYWKPKRLSAPVVAFSNAWTEKGVMVPFSDVAGRDKRVTLGAVTKKSDRRLFLVPGKDFGPEEAFLLLLDSADDALGDVTAGHSH
ncbi:MAG: hypothetical protein IPL75_09815 [Acidobacteria bacterium]|nr:hypothetical protein [Acidobacteriota bacterium]